jgi:hypothetical protein
MAHTKQAIALAAMVMAGCSTIPDVTVSYYYPKAHTQLQVTLTLACSKDGTQVVPVLSFAAPANSYLTDRSAAGKVRLKDLGGALSDADIAVALSDDGRLKSINATSTGQAGAFVKDAIALAAAVLPAGVTPKAPPSDIKEICKELAKIGGEKATVTLAYVAALDFAGVAEQPIPARKFVIDPASAALEKKLAAAGHKSAFSVSGVVGPALQSAKYGSKDSTDCAAESVKADDGVLIPLNKWSVASLKITGTDVSGAHDTLLWTTDIAIPLATCYHLPIPKAPLFGKQNFVLQLSDFGSVQKIEYGNNSGAADATDTATTIAKALKGSTTSDQTAALKAQADLIAAQTRLAQCVADPTTCK